MLKQITLEDVERAAVAPSPKKRGGRPAKTAGSFEDPGPRGRFLVEKHGIEQIISWYEMLLEKRAKEIPLSSPDMLLVGRIARAFKDGIELDRFYDRSWGKVPDRNINMNVNIEADPEKLSERAADMLSRLIE